MLRRRPIRVKLIVALALLSAIVLLLAFSGFWGLNRYRQLADAVGQRAREIPLANDLNQFAIELRASNNRIRELRDHQGMERTQPLGDPLFDSAKLIDLEEERFGIALDGIQRQLDEYDRIVQAASQERRILIDHARQSRSLREIRQTLGAIETLRGQLGSIHTPPTMDLIKQIDLIVAQSDEHLSIIHDGVDDFSKDVRRQFRTWTGIALTCTILAFLMVGLLLWACRSLVLKPFRTLLDGSRLVAGGQFDHRIDLGTGDELSELADAMNDMTDRFQGALAQVNQWCTDLDRQVQQRTREVIQNEQLASVGFLAAGVAHEINNPLATIAWSAESLQSRVAEMGMIEESQRVVDDQLCEALTTNLRRIEEEAYRCKGITEKLLDFSRLSEVRRASTDLVELVNDVVAMVGKIGKYRCKTLRVHTGDPVIAQVNPQEIRQVVLNLVTNALESVDCDGAVDVYCKTENGCASVVVKDNGCGMGREVLQHIFEPFFTRRRDGTGTGLGLSITYRIVSQHGGSLLASSDGEGCGSTMDMMLPLHADDNTSEPRNVAATSALPRLREPTSAPSTSPSQNPSSTS